MNITISTEKLLRMFSNGTFFVMDKISSIPLLQGGLLTISKDKLSLQTTNLTDFYYSEVAIPNQKETKSYCFDLKKAKEFLSFVKTPSVVLLFEENKITIESEKTKGVFQTATANDFPQKPTVKGEETILKREELQTALEHVIFSSSRDNNRPVLSGICMVDEGGKLTLVSTDGFRLSLYKSSISSVNKKTQIIISAKTISEFLKTTEEKEVRLCLDQEQKLVRFGQEKDSITTRLIEGDFPPYQKILPTKEPATKIIMEKEEFENNIKTTAVFIQGSSGAIFLNIKKEGVYIRPKDETEKASESFQEVEFEGVEQKIGFNHRYILDFLSHAKSRRVVFEMETPNSPGIFKEEGKSNYLHIIMPIRTD